jgi:hypothetical protein
MAINSSTGGKHNKLEQAFPVAVFDQFALIYTSTLERKVA